MSVSTSKNSKMGLIQKKNTETTETILKEMLLPEQVDEDLHAELKRRLGEEKCNELRENALNNLRAELGEKLLESYEEEGIEESLDSLAAIVKEAPKGKVGWRPGLDPEPELYAHVYHVDVEYVNRLTKKKQELEREIKAQEKALERECKGGGGMKKVCE